VAAGDRPPALGVHVYRSADGGESWADITERVFANPGCAEVSCRRAACVCLVRGAGPCGCRSSCWGWARCALHAAVDRSAPPAPPFPGAQRLAPCPPFLPAGPRRAHTGALLLARPGAAGHRHRAPAGGAGRRAAALGPAGPPALASHLLGGAGAEPQLRHALRRRPALRQPAACGHSLPARGPLPAALIAACCNASHPCVHVVAAGSCPADPVLLAPSAEGFMQALAPCAHTFLAPCVKRACRGRRNKMKELTESIADQPRRGMGWLYWGSMASRGTWSCGHALPPSCPPSPGLGRGRQQAGHVSLQQGPEGAAHGAGGGADESGEVGEGRRLLYRPHRGAQLAVRLQRGIHHGGSAARKGGGGERGGGVCVCAC
jgi:hypothetical protein